MWRPAPRFRPALVAGLLVLSAATLPFAGTLGHGFALDDGSEIVRNDDLRSLRNLPALFARGAWEGAGEANPIYRPLTSVTYALNFAAGGLDPAGYHAVNVLLHGLVALLVLAVARALGAGWLAGGLAAGLFAVHPVHVEVVANLAGRKDLLASGFSLLALLAHRRALRGGGPACALPLLAAAAALFSKESGVAAVALPVAWDLVVEPSVARGARRRQLGLYAGYAVVLLAWLLARRAAVGSFGVPLAQIPFVENPIAHAGAATRLLTAVAVLGRGLLLLVAPVRLSADYSWNAVPAITSALDPAFLAAVAAIGALLGGAFLARRVMPALLFCALWYGLGIFPASNLLVPVGTIFGERLLYLSSGAFCVAAALLAARALGGARARTLAAAGAVAVLVLGFRAHAYAGAWRDEVSLFEAAVGAQPESAKAWDLLGAAYMEEGRVDEGIDALERSVRLLSALPERPVVGMVKLGVAYERAGRLADADALYGRILAGGVEADALWRLGVVRWRQGRRDEATALWEQTVAVAPDHARAMNDLGLAFAARGELSRAEALWRRSAEVDPRSAGAWLSLGNLYERRGERARAREAWRNFLERARYGAYAAEREAIEARLRADGS